MKYSINKFKYLDDVEQAELTSILNKYPGRDSTLLLILLHTGARAAEALSIRKQDINVVDQAVFIRGVKGSNDREIPLPGGLFSLLMEQANMAPKPEAPVFPISYSRLRQIWQHYRPTTKKLHGLRHTFAINLYKRTKDLRLVQVALGHQSITNTMVYASYVFQKDELRKAMGL